jgi:hypothetical protein
MFRKMLAALALLWGLVIVTACGGQTTPAPRPVATTDLSGINLAPYTDRWFGITGVLPEGWFQVDRGFFLAGPPEDQPVTVHVQQVLGGMTLAQAQDYLLPWLSLEEFPEPVGLRESRSFDWHLYSYEHEDPRLGARRNDVALAETANGVHLVLLATAPQEYDLLHEKVFLSAVDAMAPAMDDASSYTTYAGWPAVAVLDKVGNSSHETTEFALEQCTRLRVYGLGEGTQAGMEDFGYVENAETGQIVWQMYSLKPMRQAPIEIAALTGRSPCQQGPTGSTLRPTARMPSVTGGIGHRATPSGGSLSMRIRSKSAYLLLAGSGQVALRIWAGRRTY